MGFLGHASTERQKNAQLDVGFVMFQIIAGLL